MDKISKIISALFSPILVPTYGMAIAGTLTILHLLPVSLIWTAVGITFVITCLVPVTAIMAMYRTGYIKDPGLNERTERTIPYIVACVINIIVNRWWKISAHAAGMGGLVALMFRIIASHYALYNLNVWLSVMIIVAGMVMTSRVYLKRHTLWQVLAGFANGFICVYLLSMIH